MTNFLDKINNNIRDMRRARITFCLTRKNASKHQRQEFVEWRMSDEAYVLIEEQLKKLGYICPVCQQKLSQHKATIDHIVPLSRAYHKAMNKDNFLVMCWNCNKRKYNTPFSQWYIYLSHEQQVSLNYAIRLIHGKAKLEELIPY